MPRVALRGQTPSARVLSLDGGLSAFDRLSRYLDEDAARAAAAPAEAAALVVDDPGDAAGEAGAALRAAGAYARIEGSRLIASGSRAAFGTAAAALHGGARALADEMLRAFDADRCRPPSVRLRGRSLDLGERARVMGILNVTPDSFFDGGRYSGVDRARARAEELVAQGADIVDIGGQSYSSSNPRIDADEERARVVPVVEALVRDGLGVALSIDTFKSDVARAALDAGADLINDCSGLSDANLAPTVARYDAALVVMHLRGELNVRLPEYPYADALGEIVSELRELTGRAAAAGVAADSILVDPGLEFGKEPATDLEILEHFGDLRSLGYPILFASSRKRFIGRIFNRPAPDLLVPSLATAALGIAAGARVVRVHDVAETTALARMLGVVARDNRLRQTFAAIG
jgi:dihydropteroate synthase